MTNNILNLTQHSATPSQVEAGVVDLKGEDRERLIKYLTFSEAPDRTEIFHRAMCLVELTKRHGFRTVMIGGALWLMPMLAKEMSVAGIDARFSFSVRESEEVTLPDGSVRKTQIFKHAGWVPACL